MVSHPENGSDSPIGSDRNRGRDRYIDEYWFTGPRCRFYSYVYHVIAVGTGDLFG